MAQKSKFPLSYVVVFFAALTFFMLWSRPRGARNTVPLSRTIAYHSATLQTARVLQIIDGDTLQVSVVDPATRRNVALSLNIYGIETPGLAGKSGQPQPLGQHARDYLESFITPGTEIEIDLKGRNAQGLPCAVFLAAGGRDAACVLIEVGLARVKISETDPLGAHYHQAQQVAQSSRTGIWK